MGGGDKLKVGCCASADGCKPEAFEYDIAADHYRVRIDGEWHDVPADAVFVGPNKFGFAVVWLPDPFQRRKVDGLPPSAASAGDSATPRCPI